MKQIITNEILSIVDLGSYLDTVFKDTFHLSHVQRNRSLNVFNSYISHFRKDIYVLVEFPYVDKVYRDSYYHYYSSKNQKYERDCIKLSFFENKYDLTDFRTGTKYEELQNSYLGFVVIRPTFPHIIGRSFVDPCTINSNNFKICKTTTNTTAAGLKFNVTGFPHSSQNTETIACAETTIWAIMEYFGMRYPEYTPTLPSKISSILNDYSFERLMPSKGLRADQISYAIKELGFGVKLYSQQAYKNDFLILLRMYIESGIPVIIAIQSTTIGHAQCVIGRSRFSDKDVDDLKINEIIGSKVKLIDLESMPLKYIFVDDNFPPYQIAPLEDPASFYTNPEWKGCEITNFIVPLYSKIYLDASAARAYAKAVLKTYLTKLGLITEKELIIKVFLASSRSYKDYCCKNETLSALAKELIVRQTMPKFIWIAELSSRDLIKQNLINGLLIIDATETKQHGLIGGFMENMYFTENLNEIVQINVPLHPFKNFNQNLR